MGRRFVKFWLYDHHVRFDNRIYFRDGHGVPATASQQTYWPTVLSDARSVRPGKRDDKLLATLYDNVLHYRNLQQCIRYGLRKDSPYRMRHQNPDKSNNFFKQNVFNENLNIRKNSLQKILYKKFSTWNLGDPPIKHNYSIYSSPISLNDGLYSLSEVFARTLSCSAVYTDECCLNSGP